MKTYLDLRSMTGSRSWARRGLAMMAMLLVAAAVGSALVQALRLAEVQAPAAPQAALPAQPTAASAGGSGSGYSGSAHAEYVEYVTGRPLSGAAQPAAISDGTGADGSAYIEYISPRPTAQPAPRPDMSIIGTGSVYDERLLQR